MVSGSGKFLAVAVDRYSGERANLVGELVYEPNYFEIDLDIWPFLDYSSVNGIWFSLKTDYYQSRPKDYDIVEQVVKVFRAGDFGYEPVADVVLPYSPRAATPTISRVIGDVVEGTRRAGFKVTQSHWFDRMVLTAAVHMEGEKWKLYANHSGTNTHNINKSSHKVSRELIGVLDSGECLIQEDTYSTDYEVLYSRPTVSNIESIEFYRTPPIVGTDRISAFYELVNNESGSYEARFKYRHKESRKYSHGPDIVIREKHLEGIKSGSFYKNLIPSEGAHYGESQVQYHCQQVYRDVLLQRLQDGLLVYTETTAELSHHSSAAYGGEGDTINPSTALPIQNGRVVIWYRGVETAFPVEPRRYEYACYANIGTNVTAHGELTRSSPTLEYTEALPEGREGQTEFLSIYVDDIVIPMGAGGIVASAVCAKCPQTPGLLLEISVGVSQNREIRRFLVDPVAGVRPAEAVLEWPEAAKSASFSPF